MRKWNCRTKWKIPCKKMMKRRTGNGKWISRRCTTFCHRREQLFTQLFLLPHSYLLFIPCFIFLQSTEVDGFTGPATPTLDSSLGFLCCEQPCCTVHTLGSLQILRPKPGENIHFPSKTISFFSERVSLTFYLRITFFPLLRPRSVVLQL